MTAVPTRQAPRAVVPAPRKIRPLPCLLYSLDKEIVVPADAHTLSGFRTWTKSDRFPEQGRICFLDQEIFIDMSPEERETHNKVKGETDFTIIKLNKRLKKGEYFSDGTLLTNPSANLSTEPDGTFALWETLESGKLRLIPREDEFGQYIELDGSPDWIMEIVSKSSVQKDTKLLRELYHRARITEYWLIDARSDEIDFQILIHTAAGYVNAAVDRGGWQTSAVFGRKFRLTRRRGRMELWEYSLQVRRLR